MSLAGRVLSHLRTVRYAANRDMQGPCEASSAEVARACAQLIRQGLIKRVDEDRGRGSVALYALPHRNTASLCKPRKTHLVRREPRDTDRKEGAKLAVRRMEVEARKVDRDPCARCGVPHHKHDEHGCHSYAEALAA